MEKEKKKMGRPSNNPRMNKLGIRLSDNEIEMLEISAKELNVTRTEIIAQGIKKVYSSLKK